MSKLFQIFLIGLFIFINHLSYAIKPIGLLQETSRRPIFKWGAVKGVTGYKIILKQIDANGHKIGESIKETLDSDMQQYQPAVNLSDGSNYVLIVKSLGKKTEKLTIYFKVVEKYIYINAQQLLPDGGVSFAIYDVGESDSSPAELWASLQFPDGVNIYLAEVYSQGDGAIKTNFSFRRFPLSDQDISSSEFFLDSVESNVSGNWQTLSVSTKVTIASGADTIDNENYSYSFAIKNFGSGGKFQQARIYYDGETVQ